MLLDTAVRFRRFLEYMKTWGGKEVVSIELTGTRGSAAPHRSHRRSRDRATPRTTAISVSRSRLDRVAFVARSRSSSSRHGPSFGCGCTLRSYANAVSPERITFRTTFRETFSSRLIALMALPCTKYPRRIFAIVSTTSILNPAPVSTGALWGLMSTGSRLDADHLLSGVLLPRRSTTCSTAAVRIASKTAAATAPTPTATRRPCARSAQSRWTNCPGWCLLLRLMFPNEPPPKMRACGPGLHS